MPDACFTMMRNRTITIRAYISGDHCGPFDMPARGMYASILKGKKEAAGYIRILSAKNPAAGRDIYRMTTLWYREPNEKEADRFRCVKNDAGNYEHVIMASSGAYRTVPVRYTVYGYEYDYKGAILDIYTNGKKEYSLSSEVLRKFYYLSKITGIQEAVRNSGYSIQELLNLPENELMSRVNDITERYKRT